MGICSQAWTGFWTGAIKTSSVWSWGYTTAALSVWKASTTEGCISLKILYNQTIRVDSQNSMKITVIYIFLFSNCCIPLSHIIQVMISKSHTFESCVFLLVLEYIKFLGYNCFVAQEYFLNVMSK